MVYLFLNEIILFKIILELNCLIDGQNEHPAYRSILLEGDDGFGSK